MSVKIAGLMTMKIDSAVIVHHVDQVVVDIALLN